MNLIELGCLIQAAIEAKQIRFIMHDSHRPALINVVLMQPHGLVVDNFVTLEVHLMDEI